MTQASPVSLRFFDSSFSDFRLTSSKSCTEFQFLVRWIASTSNWLVFVCRFDLIDFDRFTSEVAANQCHLIYRCNFVVRATTDSPKLITRIHERIFNAASLNEFPWIYLPTKSIDVEQWEIKYQQFMCVSVWLICWIESRLILSSVSSRLVEGYGKFKDAFSFKHINWQWHIEQASIAMSIKNCRRKA